MIQFSRHLLPRRSLAAGCSIRVEQTFPSAGSANGKTTNSHSMMRATSSKRFFSSQLIPQRTFWDTVYAGTKGLISLLSSESSRQEFLKITGNDSIINAAVLKKARFGSLLTTALFHDLQNPLFHQYHFHPADFLLGVIPSLQNFHDTIGRLQNQFPEVNSKEERAEKLMQRVQQLVVSASLQSGGPVRNSDNGSTIADNFWIKTAVEDRESLAGKLNVMATTNVIDNMFLATEAASMLAKYQEGSATVEYVALLSARAMVVEDDVDDEESQVEQPTSETSQHAPENDKQLGSADDSIQAAADVGGEPESSKHAIPKTELSCDNSATDASNSGSSDANQSAEIDQNKPEDSLTAKAVDDDTTKAEESKTAAPANHDRTPVAAQIEVLYEMNQMVEPKAYSAMDLLGAMGAVAQEDATEKKEHKIEPRQEVQLWVGTFEGWLNGGPEGELRWKITRLRLPDAEFPDLYRG